MLFLYLTFKLFYINVQSNSKIVVNLDVGKKKKKYGHFRTASGLLDEGVHTCPLNINRSRPSEVCSRASPMSDAEKQMTFNRPVC